MLKFGEDTHISMVYLLVCITLETNNKIHYTMHSRFLK